MSAEVNIERSDEGDQALRRRSQPPKEEGFEDLYTLSTQSPLSDICGRVNEISDKGGAQQ